MTGGIVKANHVIGWEEAKIVDKEFNQTQTSQRCYQNQQVSTRHEPEPGSIQPKQHLQAFYMCPLWWKTASQSTG